MILDSILPIPDIFSAKRVLAIQPHYDDNDIAAGGTLARLSAAGARVDYLTVTDDQLGLIDPSLSFEDAEKVLRSEQTKAGRIIGVGEQHWLGYPDAGEYNQDELARKIIRVMREFKPDLIFCPDPWLPYEAHPDHVRTGLAAACATQLFGLPRLKIDAEIDMGFKPYELLGVAFYFTREPNVFPDISREKVKKDLAIQSYKAQFTPEGMDQLLMVLEAKAQALGQAQGVEYAEGLKVLQTLQLHCGL
jgi:LmbE family N-acetylglucosaminyl deacetylase